MPTRTTRGFLGLMTVASLAAVAWAWAPWSISPPRPTNRSVQAAAAASISDVLGAQNPTYRVARSSGELAGRSGALTERFGQAGVMLGPGSQSLGLELTGWGRAGRLQRPGMGSPSVVGNRVTYQFPDGKQWFANGPLGLEQGFTITGAPAGEGPLRLELGVSGNVSVSGHDPTRLTLSDQAGTRLTYSGLTAFDAAGHELRATLAASGHRITISVADRGARYPIVVDPFIQLAKLVDPSGTGQGRLGDSVALGGNTIVAAAAKDGQSDTFPTEIDVFVEPSSGWGGSGALVATLSAGTQADDFGGIPGSLSISSDGSVVVVGAPKTDVGANAEQGVAYVFQRPAGGWSGALAPSATLKNTAGSAGDQFGSSVAVSPDGKTAVIGVPQDGTGGSANGQVDVYAEGSSWTNATAPSAVLTDSSLSGASLGSAVGIGGTAIAATAPGAHGTTGQTDVFVEPGSSWKNASTPDAQLLPDGSTSDDNFGHELAISSSGNLIAVGAPNRSQGQGAVYVYQLSAPPWHGDVSQSATLLGPTGTASDAGAALAVDDTTVLAGAPFATLDNMPSAGAGYVYAEPASGWQSTSTPDATLSTSDPAMKASAGSSVAMSNGIAVLGAAAVTVNGANDQGALYVFGPQPVTPPPGSQPLTAPSLDPSPTMKWAFAPGKSSTTIRSMSIAAVPAAASVKVLCKGHGCPFSSRSVKPAAQKHCTGKGKHRTCKPAKAKPYGLKLGGLFHRRRLGVGAEITVEVSQPGRIGKAFVFTFQASQKPTNVIACLAPGSTTPGSGCS